MKKIAKVPVTFESKLSLEEFTQKVDQALKDQEEDLIYAEKGRPLFCWQRFGSDEFVLKYFHSYRSDMCDTAFYGRLNKGLMGCQLDGAIKKPGGIWAIFWVIIGVAVLIAAAFGIALLISETPETGLIPIFLLVLVPVAFVEVNLLMFDKKRLKAINKYLREFISADNIDVLSEELEDER